MSAVYLARDVTCVLSIVVCSKIVEHMERLTSAEQIAEFLTTFRFTNHTVHIFTSESKLTLTQCDICAKTTVSHESAHNI